MGSSKKSERLADLDPNTVEDQLVKLQQQIADLMAEQKRQNTQVATLKATLNTEATLRAEQNKEQNKEISTLKAALKTGLAKQHAKMEELKGNLYKVFYPSVLHSLLETAVKECLKEYGYADKTGQQKYFHHQCCNFAHCTLRKMLGDGRGSLPDKEIVGFRATKNQTATSLTQVIHLGIRFFVEALDAAYFANWPPDRNPLMHNGAFIDALYGRGNAGASSGDTMIDDESIETILEALSKKVKCAHEIFTVKLHSGSVDSYKGIEAAIRGKNLQLMKYENLTMFSVEGAKA